MSNIQMIIEEKAANIGNFLVGRLLPFTQKRNVGPFVFIDHMGPVGLKSYENLDVPPHPHIGLSTLTYLFEGSIMHRDSLGSELEISEGAVNWMTAGKGVTHSERTPEYLRTSDKNLHGLQIWVALPKDLENMEPQFFHANKEDIPNWKDDEVKYRLIAGELFGYKSPVPVHSPLYFLELKNNTSKDKIIEIGDSLFGETAMYILNGMVNVEDADYGEKNFLVAKDSKLCKFILKANSTVYIFGGDAFPEPRHIFWNFVSTSVDTIEKAKELWINKAFPKVVNDDGYVPLPEQNKNLKLKK